jgi:hypothetical protein
MKTILSFLLLITMVCHAQQWVQTGGTPVGGGVTDMVITSNGTIVVTCASFNWPAVQGGIRHSTNSGTTWVNDFQHYTARTLALGQNGYVFASSWDFPANNSEGLWVSTNHGANWGNHRYLVGSGNNIFSILVKDNNQTVYLGTRTGILKSTDGGFGYISVNNGIPANSWVRALALAPGGQIAAATTNGVFISTNNGTNWTKVSGIPAADTIVSLEFDNSSAVDGGSKLLMGTDNKSIYESLEQSEYLFALLFFIFSEGNSEVADMRMILGMYLASEYPKDTTGGGVSISTNGGANFTRVNEGLPNNPKTSALGTMVNQRLDNVDILETYVGLFENTNNGAKIYKRSFPIGIQQISSEIPNNFSLLQNYPNPFNPMTKIKFNLSKTSNVNITVFDVLGSHITTLVNEKLGAGEYETEWNANNMPGGVYFYKLETESFTETKKMILVK